MRRTCLWIVLALLQTGAWGQDFSNKGKDFWLCFPSHVPNERDGTFFYAKMSLFITGDRNSSGTATIPGILNKTFTVAAGQVTEIDIPYNLAHIDAADAAKVIRKGIRVQVDAGKPPVVLYAHIYAGFRSAASLILPIAVLGKKYYSMNGPQLSISGSKSQFVVVAVDSNTTVLITPVRNGVKGIPVTVQLPLPGDLYELQDNVDLSGSLIESVSANTEGCKKIAVFSGSSAIHINAGPNCTPGESYDPLYQQLYPVNAWGKKYGFLPFQNYSTGNPYRVIASEDNTSININGFPVAMLNAGQYYPDNSSFGQTETKGIMISADKPISVAQYAQSSSCTGLTPPAGTGYGDPDMVLLNPIEQNVNDITVFSSQKENIFSDSKFINVLIKEQATASFTINGVAPAVTWSPVLPAGSGYAYAKIPLGGSLNAYTLKADSSFNAIAYGFGDFESYAYSAGTNVKDLYQTLTIENEFGNGTVPVGCSNSSFRISVTFPYQPQKISFNFYGLFPDQTINNPVAVESFVMNGKTVYRYRLSNNFTVNTPGIYPLTVIGENNSNTGCDNGLDEIDYEIRIVDRPKAVYTYTHSGCITDAVQFTDASDAKGNTFVKWYWNFGDNNISQVQSPSYSYAAGNIWTAKHWAVTDIGCGTDTVSKEIAITNVPIAAFDAAASVCTFSTVLFNDLTAFTGNGNIVSRVWDFGDNVKDTITGNSRVTHIYQSDNTFTATLQVQTSSGCRSALIQKQITTHPSPVAAFEAPGTCLADPYIPFTDRSTIVDGSESSFRYQWTFNDPNATAQNPNSSIQKDARHTYTATGEYAVKLHVTSGNGCDADTVINIVVNGSKPKADFTLNGSAELCNNKPVILQDASTVDVGNIIHREIYWNYDNDPLQKTTDDNQQGGKTYSHQYPASTSDQSYRIRYIVYSGISCLQQVDSIITVKRMPVVQFNPLNGVCEDVAPYIINAASETSGLGGNGIYAGPGISPDGLFNPAKAHPGFHTLYYTFNAGNGCVITEQQKIEVFASPAANAGADKATREGNSVKLDGSGTGEGIQFQWTPPANMDNARIASPVVSPAKDMTYMLTVISAQGCSASDETNVRIINQINIPNAFSPDNNSKNDTWKIPYLQLFDNCTVQVFNRWGQRVFQSKGYSRPWDGIFNDQQLPSGVYTYIIDLKTGQPPLKGFVILVR